MSIKTFGNFLKESIGSEEFLQKARNKVKYHLGKKEVDGVATGQGLKSLTPAFVNDTIIISGLDYLDKFDMGQPAGTQVSIQNLKVWRDAKGKDRVPKNLKAIQSAIYNKGTIKRFDYKGSGFTRMALDDILPDVIEKLESNESVKILEIEILNMIAGRDFFNPKERFRINKYPDN